MIISETCTPAGRLRRRLTAEQLTRLKREFLDARKRFFARQTQLLSSFDSGEYLRGAIDIFKAKLTGVVAQFEASFGDSLNGGIVGGVSRR